ncbi:MAG: hypothetical protein ACMUIP_07365 [bacterium]
MLLYAGVILIAFSILFIIIAVAFASYKSHHDKIVERFKRKGNKILTWEDINDLCTMKDNQCQHVMEVFNSAIITHAPIDGIRYYTKYPHSIFSVFAGHDGHRRTLIADWVGEAARNGKLPDDHVDMAVNILKKLTNSHREYSYTQLVAWNSLSKIACSRKPLLGENIKKKEILKILAKKGTGSIGAQKLVFTLINREDLDEKMKNDCKKIVDFIFAIDNFTVKAILYYKIKISSHLDEEQKATLLKGVKLSPRLCDFIIKLDYFSYGFTMEELKIGLKNFGMYDPPYVRSSSEAWIVSLLIKDCLIEIGMPGATYLFDKKRLKEKENLGNVALFEKDDPRKREIISARHIDSLFKDQEIVSDTSRKNKEKKEDCEIGVVKIKREGLLYFEKEIKDMANRMANSKKR